MVRSILTGVRALFQLDFEARVDGYVVDTRREEDGDCGEVKDDDKLNAGDLSSIANGF